MLTVQPDGEGVQQPQVLTRMEVDALAAQVEMMTPEEMQDALLDLCHTLRVVAPFTYDGTRQFSTDELKLMASIQHQSLLKLTAALGWRSS